MANNRVNKKGKYSDYDIAVFIAMEKFYEKMVDYLKKALIYGHTSRISS